MSVKNYRDKVRVRVNGLLLQEASILLAQIKSPVSGKLVWMPPGGGLEFGEALEACLCREFQEETGLKIKIGEFQFLNELIEPPFHAVELYFKVTQTGGTLKVGSDPEHDSASQLIKEVRWIPISKLSEISLAPRNLDEHVTRH